MTPIVSESADEFLRRFESFYDAAIRSLEISYAYVLEASENVEPSCARLVLSARDTEASGRWSRVQLHFADVQEFKVIEADRGYDAVLSDGLKIRWFDGCLFVDFYDVDRDFSLLKGFGSQGDTWHRGLWRLKLSRSKLHRSSS
jgi:hypothetical protein